MEAILLKDYYNILRKHYKLFIAIVLICVLLAIVITYAFPKNYQSSINIYVRHKGASSELFYTYDGYYSTQASVEYTSTVAGFLESLSTLSNAALIVQSDPLYKEGGYQPTDPASQPDYLSSFQRNVDVKITAPQLIEVSVTNSSPVVAQLWSQSLGTVVTNDLKLLNQQGDSNFNIDTIHAPITQ